MGLCSTYYFRSVPLFGGRLPGVGVPGGGVVGGVPLMAVEPAIASLVQSSWTLIHVDIDGIGRDFFARLFALMPEARRLFGFSNDPNFLTSRSLRVHAVAVLRTVGKFVAGLTDLKAFTPLLLRLGRSHAAAGVPVASFGVMRDVMLEVLGKRLGALWTPEVAAAWMAAFDTCAASIVANYTKGPALEAGENV